MGVLISSMKPLEAVYQTRTKELEGLQQSIEELTAQVQSLEGSKGWLELRLKETEENMEKNTLEKQEEIKRLQQEHSLQLEAKVSKIIEVTKKLDEVKKKIEEQNKTIGMLKQEIEDTLDGQRILEKKGSAVLKDLKRQLLVERKRADKLQERLQEILTNTKTRTGLDQEMTLNVQLKPGETCNRYELLAWLN
ncbi:GRIP1-associated protein 1-like [Aplochiton taeniatus]